jgi:orotidine-5'-phosphate decarboxylase
VDENRKTKVSLKGEEIMQNSSDITKKIIVALDVEDRAKALTIIQQLPEISLFKIGLKLFTAEGPSLLTELNMLEKGVFLDLKLHDIPNTVAGAVEMGVRHGASMMTLHTSGGEEMMARAVEAAQEAAQQWKKSKLQLMGVTVLTSLKDQQLKEIGVTHNAAEHVLHLAHLAQKAGLDGIVCSPHEIELIKAEFGKRLLIVTPGIRPAWAAAQDQKRIMTPSQAVEKGADFLVIGRPIIAAPSPQQAFLKIKAELHSAHSNSDRKNRT